MNGNALRTALGKLGLTPTGFAALICVNSRTVRRWLAGDMPLPAAVVLLLRAWLNHPDDVPPL